jgi:hypothetical protein
VGYGNNYLKQEVKKGAEGRGYLYGIIETSESTRKIAAGFF